jgi:hypothetical protein
MSVSSFGWRRLSGLIRFNFGVASSDSSSVAPAAMPAAAAIPVAAAAEISVSSSASDCASIS